MQNLHPKQEEILSKLPIPPQSMLRALWDQFHSSGALHVLPPVLGPGDVAFLCQFVARVATAHLKTAEGKRWLLSKEVLNLTQTPATYMKQYYIANKVGDPEHQLEYTDLHQISGWLYQDKSGPETAIEIFDRPDLTECEHCGGRSPKGACVKVAQTYVAGKETLESLCNHCRLFSDTPKVRDTAQKRTCEDCEYTSCAYNPKRKAQAMSEESAKRADWFSSMNKAPGPQRLTFQPQ